MAAISIRVRQPAPRGHHLVQDNGLLWIIRDGLRVRTGEHQLCAGWRRAVNKLSEALHHTSMVLEAILV